MWLVMLLPLLAITNGLAIPIAGLSVRAEQLAACVLVIPLIASALLGARRIRIDATAWWLAAILVMNLLSTGLHSPAVVYSLLQCASLSSVWVIYVLVVNFLDTREAAADISAAHPLGGHPWQRDRHRRVRPRVVWARSRRR